MKAHLVIAAAAFATFSLAASASPDCTSAPKEQWMPEAAMKHKLEDDGYAIRKFKTTRGNCYEIYGIDKSGAKVEIYVNPVDGSIVRTKRSS